MVPGMLLAVLKSSPSVLRPSAEASSSERIMPVTREAVVPKAMIRPARDRLAAAGGATVGAAVVVSVAVAPGGSSGAGIQGGAASVSSRRGGHPAARTAGAPANAGGRRGGTLHRSTTRGDEGFECGRSESAPPDGREVEAGCVDTFDRVDTVERVQVGLIVRRWVPLVRSHGHSLVDQAVLRRRSLTEGSPFR